MNGVLAHAHPEYQRDRMTRAIVAADALAGLLVASALVRPERSAGMKVSSVKKKLKERAFAPGVNREEIALAEPNLGLDRTRSSVWASRASRRSRRRSASSRPGQGAA